MWKIKAAVAMSAALGIFGVTADAHAWGDLGHKAICQIAIDRVKPGTRAAIERLIAADGEFASFPDSCTWPDHPRKRAAEHFVNLPRDAAGLTSNCGEAPECVVSAIAKDFAVLSSKTASDDQKAASLKFLGHWVGDIHQPLHVSFKDDRGGNNIKVSGECNQNLHSAWDTCLVIAAIGSDAAAAAQQLSRSISPAQIQAWTLSDPRQWANEAFKTTESAQTQYCVMHGSSCDQHSGDVKIDRAYIDANVPIVKEQIQKAAIRLASLLDKALSD